MDFDPDGSRIVIPAPDANGSAPLRLPFPPIVLGIAGASGSGKTTLALELARQLHGVHFPIDNYYRDLSHLPLAERIEQNFDDPALIESPLLVADVAALAKGEPIERPVYDFARYVRVPAQSEAVHPGECVLVEGLFALCFADLLPVYQFRLYLDTDDEVCFSRRMKRDVEQRGRNEDSVRRQYVQTVRPSFLRFVRPSAAHADLVLDGAEGLDWKVEQVLAALRQRGLVRGAR